MIVLGILAMPRLSFAADLEACLCVMPPILSFERDDPRTIDLENRVVARLEAAGFAVRPSREVEPIQDGVDSDREFFDSATGELLPERWAERERDLSRALRDHLGCDARVEIGVRRLMAINSGGSAVWDGHSVPIATKAFAILMAGQISRVAALSFWIELSDPAGESLAYRSAGIEPLIQLSLNRSIDLLPEDRWLRDDAAVARAVESALGPRAIHLRHHGQPVTQAREFPFPWPDRR